jgi:hypothetical protein
VELTLADIIAEIEQARVMALAAETVQASAAVSASKAKAELLGLGAPKKVESLTTLAYTGYSNE